MTQMMREAAETPARVAAQAGDNEAALARIVQRLRRKEPPFVVTCARGSSDHAATFAKYLFETRAGLIVSSFAPSVASLYKAQPTMKDALFLAISQSGRSPDLLTAAEAARRSGAYVVAVVNDAASPLAQHADDVLPVGAGPEISVAATKSCIASMSALYHLCAAWLQDGDMAAALGALPAVLDEALRAEWSEAQAVFETAAQALVVSRGFGYAAAQEAALKFKETSNIQAEAFSAAEVRHGPMAIVENGFPVLTAATLDVAQAGVDDVASDFARRGARVFSASPERHFRKKTGAVLLPMPAAPAPELQPLVFLQSFYPFANRVSLARGFDPDNPVRLQKVTATV